MVQSKKSSGAYKITVNLKSIQILFPISLLSFLFSQSSTLDGLLNMLYTYGCSGSVRAERTYAFLLFNGLLALLIKKSGGLKRDSDSIITSLKIAKPADSCDSSGHKIEVTVHKDDDNDIIVPDVIEILVDDDEEEVDRCDDEEEVDRCDDEDDEEEETEEQVVEWVISVEELNRKCDDFIKNKRHLL